MSPSMHVLVIVAAAALATSAVEATSPPVELLTSGGYVEPGQPCVNPRDRTSITCADVNFDKSFPRIKKKEEPQLPEDGVDLSKWCYVGRGKYSNQLTSKRFQWAYCKVNPLPTQTPTQAPTKNPTFTPAELTTTGGYVPEGTVCYNPDDRSRPVCAEFDQEAQYPRVRRTNDPRPPSDDEFSSHWCYTGNNKYSSSNPEKRYEWGYCKKALLATEQPTKSPTESPSVSPKVAVTNGGYEVPGTLCKNPFGRPNACEPFKRSKPKEKNDDPPDPPTDPSLADSWCYTGRGRYIGSEPSKRYQWGYCELVTKTNEPTQMPTRSPIDTATPTNDPTAYNSPTSAAPTSAFPTPAPSNNPTIDPDNTQRPSNAPTGTPTPPTPTFNPPLDIGLRNSAAASVFFGGVVFFVVALSLLA